MDARGAVSSCSFVLFLILSIEAICGSGLVGGTAQNSSSSTVAAHLAPEIEEKLATLSEEKEDEDDNLSNEEVVEGVGAPFDHEDPRDNPNLGWSKVSPTAARLEFVPTKLYAQVRRTHTVKHLPREDAAKSAAASGNEEEILAAPRLREVVSKSKTNTIYTEEGYEDAAYDHGGHIRDAEFQEGYDKKLGDEEETPPPPPPLLDDREKLEHFWRDASLNPKDVTENEIERLEEDLEREYVKSEKKAEIDAAEKPTTASSAEEEEEEEVGESTAATSLTDVDNVSTSLEPSAEYGKILWDYFKSMGKKDEAVNPSSVEEESSVVGATLTNVPSPATKFGDIFASDRRKDAYPSAASLYESWKRRDRYANSDESREFESFESYTPRSEEKLFEDHTLVNLQNVEGSTTLVGPKKLSYTIIIRPKEKMSTAMPSCPCGRQVEGTRHGERTLIVKSFPREELSREALNDFSNANDYNGIRAPQPVPAPRQVTYADFPPDSYPSPTQSSVSREIGTSTGGERSRNEQSKNFYANSGQNLGGNGIRAYRKKPRLVFHPRTRLVPPPPLPTNGNKYSQFLGVKASGKGTKEKIMGRKWWPEMMRFYQSFERRVFGRRKRSLGASVEGDGKMPKKRNRFEERGRTVGPDNAREEKSQENNTERSHSGDERLLREAPRIVDKVINGEIEARFKKHERSSDVDEKDDGIEVRVPEFNLPEEVFEEEDESGDGGGGKRVIGKATGKDTAFVDLKKYPFYENSKVGQSSALKYATDPRKIPHKTPGGTEFYDSRDAYRECDEVRPKLEIALSEEDEEENSSVVREKPRLRGLGESLDCFRGKYLDDDPLDNPLFLEEQVGQPRVPEQLDPRKLHLTISEDPSSEEYVESEKRASSDRVIRRISRRPAIKRRSRKAEDSPPGFGRTTPSPYQRQVSEDVTGTMKNVAADLFDEKWFGEAAVTSSKFNRRLVPYTGTNRVSYSRKWRKGEGFPGEEEEEEAEDAIKTGYFTSVSVRKRSVNNEEQQSLLESNATTNNNDNEMRIVYTIRDRMGGSKPPKNLARGRRVTTMGPKRDSSGPEKKEPATVDTVETLTPKNATTSEADDEQQQQQQQQRYLDEPNDMYKINGNRRTDEKAEESLSDSGGRIESMEAEPRFLELREYLRSDPPGYREEGGASGNESSDDASMEKSREDFRASEGYENSEESREERPSPSAPGVADEESEKEFERFASRPFSPFESFEDPKYRELGPRLSKPYFHHPSFSSVISNRRLEYPPSGDSASVESVDGAESVERDDAKSRFSFPWDVSSHDEKQTRSRIDRHEYPWERRERLARERRTGRAKEQRQRHQRLYGFDDDGGEEDDEDDASERKTRRERFVYPWDGYRLPSRIYGGKGRIYDNEETSSVARPRFSSRYKTNIARRVDENEKDDPVESSGADNREIKMPVTKSLVEAKKNGTLTSKKSIRRKIASPSTSTADSTVSPPSTTKKALILRKRIKGRVANGRIELPVGSPKFSIKTRARGPIFDQLSTTTTTTTTTSRTPATGTTPVSRRRFRMKNPVERATVVTPKVKTVEHRSRFSNERIITKTSYPAFNDSRRYAHEDDRIGQDRPGERAPPEGERGTPMISNETVRQVSIMTKETPDRVYRAKQINDNGVTDTFVTVVTSKNGTNSSLDAIEARKMLESFDESEQETNEDSFGSRDTNLLANLLTRVPPYTNHLTTLAEIARGSEDFSEGSGFLPDEYEKHPERRLYFYVHDL